MTVAGNREFGHGDEITCDFQDSTDAEAGDGVYVSGHSGSHTQVQLADDSNGPHGVIEDSATSGDHVNVHFGGAVWARVDDDDDVSAGDTVGRGSGTEPVGELSSSGTDYLVLEGEVDIGGTKYALVHLTANAV